MPRKKRDPFLYHLQKCSEYKKRFLEEKGYLYCELCGVSNAIAFETHHIVFASEVPKHKNLHNDRNLILLCDKCHAQLHRNKSLRQDLIKQRKLKKLFQGYL